MNTLFFDHRTERKEPIYHDDDHFYSFKHPNSMPVDDFAEHVEPVLDSHQNLGCGNLSPFSGPLTEKTKDGDDIGLCHELREEESQEVTISMYTEVDQLLLDGSFGSEMARHQQYSSGMNSLSDSQRSGSLPNSVPPVELSQGYDATSELRGFDDMTLLSPEASYMQPTPSEMVEETLDQLPIISREGLRKAGRRSNDRIRKSNNQVEYLKKLYSRHGIKVDRKVRNRAIKATGLSWIQIYKWLFDKHMKETARRSLSNAQYPVQIFKVIGPDGREIGKPSPIFKIEKIARSSM